MLPHGASELIALSQRCSATAVGDVNGWSVEIWQLDDDDVDASIAVYEAVLAGGATDPVVALLAEQGIDLEVLLVDDGASKDDITRADVTELIAAASVVAMDGWSTDEVHLPNVPKMSRRKSESGVDIFGIRLDDVPADQDLGLDEALVLASVKHTIDDSAGGMRWKLASSLGERELSKVYLTQQLRVLNGHLRREGVTAEAAARVYLFLRDFPATMGVQVAAVGVVVPDLKDDLAHHVTLLPQSPGGRRVFRQVLVPGLPTLAARCP